MSKKSDKKNDKFEPASESKVNIREDTIPVIIVNGVYYPS